MADLGAIDEDVEFDNGVADALISACNQAAEAVDGQVGTRSSAVSTGSQDFKGHFSQLFTANAAVAAGDASELATRLREVATGTGKLKEEARKEQERRETARAWKKEHDDRGLLEQGWDWATGGDDPPVGPPAAEPTIEVAPSVNRSRQTPAGGGGVGGGGTSSARPSNLRSFATTSQGANDTLRPKPAACKSKLSDFDGSCKWGTLNASGVFVGFDKWLAANDQDVQWATTIADAFTAAGGEGNVSTVSNGALSAALQAAGVDKTRTDLVIDPPQAYGTQPTSGYADDPVNTATGNFTESETDLAFPGAASSLALIRSYNSFDTSSGAFGPGWSSAAETGLIFDADEGAARFRLPDGRQILFPRLGGGWDRAVGENLWLESAGDGLEVSGNDGSWWRFSTAGVLLAYGTGPEADQNRIRLSRDPAGRLVGLTHGRGRGVTLVWGVVGDQDRIVEAAGSDGRRVAYGYDDDGRLVSVTTPSGTRSYRWDTDRDLIVAVVDADGVVEAENGFDASRRVSLQRSPFGRVTRFGYLPGRVTVVSDEDGTRSNTWIADERGRLVGVVDADEHRQSMSYDRYGNQVLVTERDGATTVHEYDDRGRRIRTVTPTGADLTFGFDERDRVTTVVTEQGAVTEYGYVAEGRNPSTIVDPEGGHTVLAWNSGLLTEVTDPVGVRVRFGYDTFGDLVAVTDADGNTARTERDDLGRVVGAISPSGQRTTFAYDPASGVLVSRTDPDGAVWRYEHTDAGRLSAVVDPMGARTSMERGGHGEETRTVDPLGRALNRSLDDLGRLTSVELPDGSTWRFGYDALSRLTETTDPTGGIWAQTYDATGQLTASIDPTGVRRDITGTPTEVRVGDGETTTTAQLDALGRLTSVGEVDGSSAVLVYDRCGRPVESLDVDGGLTLIERDSAGRVVAVTTPTGAVTGYRYDACGRLAAVTDPLGAETTIDYDVDGRPDRQTLPTGEIAWTTYDVCGRVVEHHRPGGGTATYRYDLAGRVVETTDPRNGRRRFEYDPAGQLVSVTDGNGGVTRYGYDANGRAAEIITAVGGVIRRDFDAMNRCVAETDPLGRTTRAGYDAAGRIAWQTDPDGLRTTWTYDAAGRPLSMAVDGRTLTTISRDLRNRTVVITDTTGDEPVEHGLEWNRRGQLIRRSRGNRQVSWTYDADGRRSAMTTPDGRTTRYGCDAAGRLTWVEHPELGRAAFDHDAGGRVVAATAGGLMQSWEHRDGFVVAHSLTDDEGATRTVIDRDAQGRIARISRDAGAGVVATSYGYDGAHQLVEARVAGGDESSLTTWRYDAGGRLVAEVNDGSAVEHVYNLAGELLTSVGGGGRRQDHEYDGLGRRIRTTDGSSVREFSWSMTGHLAAVLDRTGDRVTRTELRTDALGELAAADGSEFFWDTAAYAGAPVLVGDISVVTAGPVTGVGSDWTAPGWRMSRASTTDPWSPEAASSVGGVDIGGSGEVQIAGLEWMGARVYDPASRGFLSVDPLDPITGSGWAGNPYSFAGNDPLHALDPRGLNPVTDAELQTYRDSNGIGGTLQDIGNWTKNNWEYIAGGAMVIAGGVLIATGVGGPAGVMLISAGADTIIQKATTGEVNWGQVAVSGAAGGIGFGVGGAVAGAMARTTASAGMRTVAAGAASAVTEGSVSGAGTYLTSGGPKTVSGLLSSTARGATVSTVTAGVGGAGTAATRGISATAGRTLDDVAPTETFYRTMKPEHYDRLVGTGRVPGTSETFVSPDLDYVRNYHGVTVELNVRPGTQQALEGIGVRDTSGIATRTYPDMPEVSKGWTQRNAFFKGEDEDLINIGLGRGPALETFNDSLVNFRAVP